MSALYVRVWHSGNRLLNQLGSAAPQFRARVARVQEFCALKLLASRLDVGGL